MALPDSSLSDDRTIRDKSLKVSQFARAFSIFRVSRVYIYRDAKGNCGSDKKLLRLLLEYLDTPPYLRKRLYPMRPELRFAGLLHPIKSPHHKPKVEPRKIKVGELREALVVRKGENYYADAGLDELVPLENGRTYNGRVIIKFVSAFPKLRCTPVTRSEIRDYWGYEVKEAGSLTDLLEHISAMVIFTSRKGEQLYKLEQTLRDDLKISPSALVIFGSTKRGVMELLQDHGRKPSEFSKYTINFFPKQGTETVRLEEAILGSLSLLNYLVHA